MKDNSKKIIVQSGAIPFFIQDGQIKIVLITSRQTGQWSIPKGLIEDDMTPEASASKEALEEAGVEGYIDNKLFGEYFYEKWGATYQVEVYLLEVKKILDKWDEMRIRSRKIVTITEAIKIIKKEQLELMKDFNDYIQKEALPTRIMKVKSYFFHINKQKDF